MSYDLQQCVLRILNGRGQTVGTGFVISSHLAVSCAHVIQTAGSDCGQAVTIQFFANEQKQTAQVLNAGWSPANADDIAFLQLESLPEGIEPAVLGSAQKCRAHPYSALGFAKLAGYEDRCSYGTLEGIVSSNQKQAMLQMQGDEIKGGMSGAPVLDTETERVVGMVSEYKDDERVRLAWATTSDTLLRFAAPLQLNHPMLRLWPEAYGPEELNLYLRYLITANEKLSLPDGGEVLLERIYVSLRADEMNAVERQAEHNLYLDKVANITRLQRLNNGAGDDQYAQFDAIHRTIARQPVMFLLQTRDWPRLFGKRERHLLSLAEVEKRHRYVVILGDPGSGKTTLGKWLVLQFARALLEHKTFVQVRADLVQPGAEADKRIDLGPARLPIFIRIADYARARWDKDDDNGLSLKQFMGVDRKYKNLPLELTPTAVAALTRDYLMQGRALVVLDGLDEVSNPRQRREVMREVKSFIQSEPSDLAKNNEWGGNRLLLTSRIVGYQFDPLTNLPHYTVEDMDEMAISAFCQAWMAHVAGIQEAEEQGRKLKKAIFDHSHRGVRALAGNPLLLTILAQVYWSSKNRSLPTRRVSLFDKALEAFFEQRSARWSRVGITPKLLTRALGAVAAHIHAHAENGFVEEGTVREKLGEVLQDLDKVETVLEAARDVSGFLVERGGGVYGFLHRALQEYFAAKYLTYNPDLMYTHFTQRLLDPTWREPIVLAVGVVSQPDYPGSREHLRRVFDTLLDTDDPAGEFLPRRELLAVAACLECERERIPEQVGQRIAERLLALYARREQNQRSPVLRKRIHEAFLILRANETRLQAEKALCQALVDPNFEVRNAAIDVVIEIKWDTRAVAQALVKAWSEFADPAISLLTALDEMLERSPSCFQKDFLPLRQEVSVNPRLWEKASINLQWKAIFRILYLQLGASFKADRINRDSPLTPYLLQTLQEHMSQEALSTSIFVEIRQYLVPLASQPGTALARDAALVLSALGDSDWIKQCIENAESQRSQINAVAGCLVLAGGLEQDMLRSFPFAGELDTNLELSLEAARDFKRFNEDLALYRQSLQEATAEIQRVEPLAFQGISRIKTYLDDFLNKPPLTYTYTRDLAETVSKESGLLDKQMHIYISSAVVADDPEYPRKLELSSVMSQLLERLEHLSEYLKPYYDIYYASTLPNLNLVQNGKANVKKEWKEFYELNSQINALASDLGVSLPLDIKWAITLAQAFQSKQIRDLETRRTLELMKFLEDAEKPENSVSRKVIVDQLAWQPSLFAGVEPLRDLIQHIDGLLETGQVADEIATSALLELDLTIPAQRRVVQDFQRDLTSLVDRLRRHVGELAFSSSWSVADVQVYMEALPEKFDQLLQTAHLLGVELPSRFFVDLNKARAFIQKQQERLGPLAPFYVTDELIAVLNHIALLMLNRNSELRSASAPVDAFMDEQAAQQARAYRAELAAARDRARVLAGTLGLDLPLDIPRALEHARRHEKNVSSAHTHAWSQTRDCEIEMTRIFKRVPDLLYQFDLALAQEYPGEGEINIARWKRDLDRAQKFIDLYVRTREQKEKLARLNARAQEKMNNLVQFTSTAEIYAQKLTQQFQNSLRSGTELSKEIDLAGVRHLDFAFDFTSIYNLARPSANASEIIRLVGEGQGQETSGKERDSSSQQALASIRNVQKALANSAPIAEVLGKLAWTCMNRWAAEADSEVGASGVIRLNAEGVTNLVQDLLSPDDLRRERAKEILVSKRLASEFGQHEIERIAEFVDQHIDHPQIATQLIWTLEAVVHDQPAWIEHWISQMTDQETSGRRARIIIESVQRLVPKASDSLINALPHAETEVNYSLLKSLNWLVRLKQVPRGKLPALREKLFLWLTREEDAGIRDNLIQILGYWPEDSDSVGQMLLNWIDRPKKKSDLPVLYKAIACLAIRRPNLVEKIRKQLRPLSSDRDVAAALIRLSTAKSKGTPARDKQKELDNALINLSRVAPETSHSLEALLKAGIDDDIWDDDYHGVLVNALRAYLELQVNASPDQKLLTDLLERFERALYSRDWPSRRFLLAVVSACTEVMPVAVQQAYKGNLEELLTRAATDAESFNSRRFALSALGYLRTVTPTVVPALLAGCHDTEEVQQDTVTAASHFQAIEGDLLPRFVAEMNGESVSRAYMVTHLLSALGSSAVSETSGLRDQIVKAVVEALKNDASHREVLISGEHKGRLEDALYTTLLRVAGWMEIEGAEEGVVNGDLR